VPVRDATEWAVGTLGTQLQAAGPVRADDVQRAAGDQQVAAVRRPRHELPGLCACTPQVRAIRIDQPGVAMLVIVGFLVLWFNGAFS